MEGTEGTRGGREGGRKRWCETARVREWKQGRKVEGGLIIVFFIQSEPCIGRGMDGARERKEGLSERRKEGAGR